MILSNLFIYELKKPDKPNDCPSDWVAATGLTGAGSFCYKMVEGADTDFDGAEEALDGRDAPGVLNPGILDALPYLANYYTSGLIFYSASNT